MDIKFIKRKREKKEKKQGWKYEVLDLLKTFILCFIAVFLITRFVVKPVQVDGDSMYPTLVDEEIGFVNIFSAQHFGIERYDVVVVQNEVTQDPWVKRVIGMPNDTIYAKDDVVYVNGEPLDEPYLDNSYAESIRSQGRNFTEDFGPITLGDDEYFLMGDNRIVSYDSRKVGAFHIDDIIGKDVYVLYPFSQIKLVTNNLK